jgi:PKD repeat protein
VTLTLTADDGENAPVADTVAVEVGNVAPVLTVTSPASGATVEQGQPVHLVATASDEGVDDVLTCTVQWGDGDSSTGCDTTHTYAAAGPVTVTVRVTDGDGGADTETLGLTVKDTTPVLWPWEGFFHPVDNLPTVNVVKAGSSVPVKFSLGGFRGMDILEEGSPASAAASCSSTATSDALEEVATPGSSELTYDAGTDRYQLVWKTARSWANTCRTLVVTLADGSVHKAAFRFK